MSTGVIEQVDPTTLTIALNVRREARLDKSFVASIKELGILQPPMVTRTAEGSLEVVLGQRRTLAAVQAGLTSIPVYVVEQSEADAARVVDQLTENEQRQSLTDAERVGGYKELALIGISPAQIAKRTSTPRERVDKALAVAESEKATEALATFDITLDQAAEIVEFEDDKAAVKRLLEAAQTNPRQFPHVVRDLREKRRLKAEKDAIEADIKAAGAEVLKSTTWSGETAAGWTAIDKLGTVKDPTVPLDVKAVKKELLGGRAVQAYEGGYVFKVQWLVRDGHNFPTKKYGAAPAREQTPEDIEREKQWAKEREERQAREAAKKAAAEVRLEWIRTNLLQRKALPDTLPLVAQKMFGYFDGGETAFQAFELAGLSWPKQDDGEDEEDGFERAEQYLREHPEDAAKFALAQAALATEWGVHDGADASAVFCLEQLESWGYGLSEFERGVVDESKAEATAA